MSAIVANINLIKEALAIPLTNTSHDGLLNAMIADMSADFEILTGRQILVAEYTEYFDITPGVSSLFVQAWPIDNTKFKIYLDTERIFGEDYLLTAGTDYWLDWENGIVEMLIATTKLTAPYPIPILNRAMNIKKCIKAVYTGGMYDPSATPPQVFYDMYPDIAGAVLMEVVADYRKKDLVGFAEMSVGEHSISTIQPYDRSPHFKRVCNNHSRVRI